MKWACITVLSQPVEMGVPLPTEADTPFGDIDGRCISNAFAYFGFDYVSGLHNGRREIFALGDNFCGNMPASETPLSESTKNHYERYALTEREDPAISIVMQDGVTGDFITRQPAGATFLGKRKRRSILSRLLRRED